MIPLGVTIHPLLDILCKRIGWLSIVVLEKFKLTGVVRYV